MMPGVGVRTTQIGDEGAGGVLVVVINPSQHREKPRALLLVLTGNVRAGGEPECARSGGVHPASIAAVVAGVSVRLAGAAYSSRASVPPPSALPLRWSL